MCQSILQSPLTEQWSANEVLIKDNEYLSISTWFTTDNEQYNNKCTPIPSY